MANNPEVSEAEALDRSGGLLRYAAENKQLDQTIVAPICAAWDARQNNTWTQTIAINFWLAFNSLCSLIKPVTMDSLSTNLQELPPPWWALRKRKAVSLSKRTADRYLILLIVLLFFAVIFSFVQSKVGGLTREIKLQMDNADKLTAQISVNIATLEKDNVIDLSSAGPGDIAIATLVQDQFQQLGYLEELMLQERHVASAISTFGIRVYNYHAGTYQPATSRDVLKASLVNYKDIRGKINSYLFNEGVTVEIISSSVLPIILGLMGACAYVVRLISDQIKDATFSTTSPIRHRVRLLLGGLAGIVIGFGGIVSTTGLSSSALAFIAGYSIEPVFATLDSIAAKFRH
jgi:hypothetical protein